MINCCEGIAVTENTSSNLEKPLVQSEIIFDNVQSIDKITIKYLEEIIKQKDEIITNQKIAIQSLSDQVQLLKSISASGSAASSVNVETVQEPLAKKKLNNLKKFKRDAHKQTIPSSEKTVSDVASSSHATSATGAKLMCEIINLNNDVINNGPLTKSEPSNKKGRTRSILVGCSKNSDSDECPLRAASTTRTIYHAYHASNFEVGTDENILCNYLCNYAPSCKVEKLISRQPLRYASFKVTVLKEEAEHILQNQIWPEGVVINRFFPPRRRD